MTTRRGSKLHILTECERVGGRKGAFPSPSTHEMLTEEVDWVRAPEAPHGLRSVERGTAV